MNQIKQENFPPSNFNDSDIDNIQFRSFQQSHSNQSDKVNDLGRNVNNTSDIDRNRFRKRLIEEIKNDENIDRIPVHCFIPFTFSYTNFKWNFNDNIANKINSEKFIHENIYKTTYPYKVIPFDGYDKKVPMDLCFIKSCTCGDFYNNNCNGSICKYPYTKYSDIHSFRNEFNDNLDFMDIPTNRLFNIKKNLKEIN